MPVAFTAGGKDQLVPSESVVRLAGVLKCLQSNVLLLYRNDGWHSTNYSDGKAAMEFVIVRVLPESSKGR